MSEFCKYELRGGSFKEYTDKGYSGKNTDRPKFQELPADIRRGLIKRVVVYKLELTTIQGIRIKMMVPDEECADIARFMFEMYAEPSTSFGDIARHFAEMGIKIYDKELKRGFISQLLRNPIYAQADLEMYEFFKSQGTVVAGEAADFAGTNG